MKESDEYYKVNRTKIEQEKNKFRNGLGKDWSERVVTMIAFIFHSRAFGGVVKSLLDSTNAL